MRIQDKEVEHTMGIGKNMTRVDAFDKVTGSARYTADLEPQGLLAAKVIRSTPTAW